MKRILYAMIIGIFVLGLLFSNQEVFSEQVNKDYINIKLTIPIKSKEFLKLYSENGFSICRKDDILNELEFLQPESIKVGIKGEEIIILDMNDNFLFSYNQNEDLIFSSLDVSDKKIKVEDKTYRDYINFKIRNGNLMVINYVSMDHYLYGVVPREMPASFDMEALKAQAIAARTYALMNMRKHRNDGYDLCDTTHCQVYGGISGEHDRTTLAVDDTSGIIITYNGNIIDAVYHSNSGGRTVDSKEAWGGSVPYLVAVDDSYSIDYPNSHWSFTISKNEVNNRLKDSGVNIGNLINMEVIETSDNGRVTKLKVAGTLGEEVLNSSKVRQVLGTTELKSTWFTIKKDSNMDPNIYAISGDNSSLKKIDMNNSYIISGNGIKSKIRGIIAKVINMDRIVDINANNDSSTGDFIIEGKGYGHGVGMSQWGAQGMAKAGYSFEEIIKHYYTGVEITRQ